MVGAVYKGCLNTNHRIACKHSTSHAVAKSLFYSGEEVFGYSAAEDLFLKYKLLRLAGLKLNPNIAELTVTARLLFMSALYLYGLSYGLAVGDFGFFQLNLRTEF